MSICGSVEIARLKKKKKKEEDTNNLAVLTNSSLVLPRWLLATLTVLVVTEHSSLKVTYPQSLTTVVLAKLPHMACPYHPYTESTDSVISGGN